MVRKTNLLKIRDYSLLPITMLMGSIAKILDDNLLLVVADFKCIK